MSTIDKAQIKESPSAKDRRLNHWATPPTQTDNTRHGKDQVPASPWVVWANSQRHKVT